MASPSIMRLLRSRAPQIRSFTQTSPFLAARPSSRAPPPPVPKYGTQRKNVPNPVPARTNAPPPVPAHTNAPPPVAVRQPPKAPPNMNASSTPQTYAKGLLADAEEMLLYKGPKNVALFAASFFTGGLITCYVASVAHGAFMLYTVPWYGKVVVLAGCLVTSAMASAIFITPHHLVKTISLARTANKEVVLRVKGTRFFPFMKQSVHDLAPGELMIDTNVTGSLEGGKEGWYGVELKNAKAWTEGQVKPVGDQGNAFQRLNRSMLNIGPAIFKYTKKMFHREGMVYVRMNNSNWKMDLSQCQILENGSVLMKLCRETAVRTSLVDLVLRRKPGE